MPKTNKKQSIDVSLVPPLARRPSTMPSGTEKQSEPEDSESPLYDPRRSEIRLDDEKGEEAKSEDNAPSEEETAISTHDPIEIKVTTPEHSASEVDDEPPPKQFRSLRREEVEESARKFEKSLRILMEKTRTEEEDEDEGMIYSELNSWLSEGNVVDDDTRAVLNQMDPYDEDNCNDDTLTQRIKELVERTAAAMEAETATSPVGIVSPTAEEEYRRSVMHQSSCHQHNGPYLSHLKLRWDSKRPEALHTLLGCPEAYQSSLSWKTSERNLRIQTLSRAGLRILPPYGKNLCRPL